jgi:acyl-phosphate glycerol 3-phosphate acyltransferase
VGVMPEIGVAILVGYLIGSVPVAYLIGRLAAGVDVREVGEGNVGARNVFHEVGNGWGIAVFAGDFLKGVAVAALFAGRPTWQLATAAIAMVIGHAFPVWLGFIGGKGLSAAGGFAVALMPWGGVIGVASAGPVWLATRRFLPTLVVCTVAMFLAAPFTGASWTTMALGVAPFFVVAGKRVLDEPRMREVEARTGWDRERGGTGR